MTTIEYEKERTCKNSIRYKKTTSLPGPATIYIPNDMISDLTNPPDSLKVTIEQFWKK